MKNLIDGVLKLGDRFFGVDFSFLLRNAFWINFEKAMRAVGEIGTIVVIARTSSLAIVGQYELLVSVYTLVSVMAMTGFNAPLTRAIARGFDGTLNEVVRLSWRWSLIGVVVLLVGGWWLHGKSDIGIGLGLLYAAPMFPIFTVLKKWDVVLQAKERFFERAIYYSILSFTTLAAVVGAVIIWPESVMPVFLVVVAVQAFLNIFFFRRMRRLISNKKIEDGWMKSGYKMFLSELFSIMYSKLDKLILAVWLGVEALAIYAIAIKIGEGIKLVVGGIIGVYVPKMYKRGGRVVIGWFQSYRWRIITLILVFLIGMWFAAPIIIVALFGSQYEASVWYAQLYLLIVPFHFVASIWGYLLIREKRENVFILSSVGAGVVNIILYLVLIPTTGIFGAVVGSIGYYVALAGFYYWSVDRLRLNRVE